MQNIFDATKPATVVFDKEYWLTRLRSTTDPITQQHVINDMITTCNRGNPAFFQGELGQGALASLVGIGLNEPLTTDDFNLLVGNLFLLPFANKLRMTDGWPDIQTLFDSYGFSDADMTEFPFLKNFHFSLNVETRLRVEARKDNEP